MAWIYCLASGRCGSRLGRLRSARRSSRCHFVPAGNLTRGHCRRGEGEKGPISETCCTGENGDLSRLCWRRWESQEGGNMDGIVGLCWVWSGSFSWGGRAWRKLICKLRPVFGEIATLALHTFETEQNKIHMEIRHGLFNVREEDFYWR